MDDGIREMIKTLRVADRPAECGQLYDTAASVCEAFLYAMINPTEVMCDATRTYILGLSLGINDYAAMRENLRQSGECVPEWMLAKSGHITKWDRAEDIWKLMAAPVLKRANEIAGGGECT